MDSGRSDDLVASAEAASMIGCTPQHARLLAREGRLPAMKIGRDWLFSRHAVLKYRGEDEGESAAIEELRCQFHLYDDPDLIPITNVASVPQRSPFRYPGGKTWLVPLVRHWLGTLDRKPSLLVEPFAGGGG